MHTPVLAMLLAVALSTTEHQSTNDFRVQSRHNQVGRVLVIPSPEAPASAAALGALSKRSGFTVSRLPLNEALTLLGARSGLQLAFSPTFVPATVEISCDCAELTVGETLERMLEGTDLSYIVVVDHVLITAAEPVEGLVPTVALVAPLASAPIDPKAIAIRGRRIAHANGTVSGHVRDAQTFQPIAAAQVLVPENGIGSLTRADGSYTLTNLPPGSHTIEVQRIGYQSVSQVVTVVAGQSHVADFEPALQALVQIGTISARVTDARTLAPLPGAQVTIAELQIGGLARADGLVVLQNVPDGTHTITATRIGSAPVSEVVTVVPNGTVMVELRLSPQAVSLDEIVVTGTAGGVQRRALGNSLERLDVGTLTEVSPARSVEQLLSSRVPGVIMNAGSGGGLVGADAGVIRIRGSSSIGLPNDPIIILDGVRINSERQGGGGALQSGAMSRLSDINPNDIESMEIIKGPAAATLYGTEAANGVIQIITKRGAAGAATFDVSSEVGANWLWDPEAEFNTNWGRSTAGELISQNLYKAETERFGKAPFEAGIMQRYNIAVRGGTDLYRYSAALNRSDLAGIVPWNWDKNTSARVNVSTLLRDDLDFTLGASYLSGAVRQPGWIYAEFLRGSPRTAADYGGSNSLLRGYGVRPLEAWELQNSTSTIERSTWTAEASYRPKEWIQSRLVFGVDNSRTLTETFTPKEPVPSGYWGTGLGSKNVGQRYVRNATMDFSGTATFQPTEMVGSATSFGLQYYTRKVESLGANGSQFAVPSLSTVSAAATVTGSESFGQNNTVGVYVQQQFDWDQRIFLTMAVRADDNSAFGTNYDAAIYPKISGAWVISEEPFWRWNFFDTLRLRGAWGAAGQQPDAFAAVTLYSAVTGPPASTGGAETSVFTPSNYGSPDLGPERGEELEFGFEGSMFDNRLGFSYTYYDRVTKDAIVARPVPPSMGFPGTEFVNLGRISNWGHELSVDLNLVDRSAFRGDLSFAVATFKNRADDIGAAEMLPVDRARFHVAGYPLASQFSLFVLSAEKSPNDPATVINMMCDGGTGSDGRMPGGVAVPCAEAPFLFRGRPSEPTWSINLSPSFTLFDSWGLHFNMEAMGGHYVSAEWVYARHTAWSNSLEANTLADQDPIFLTYRALNREVLGLVKGGFAKLREATVIYTVPNNWAESLGLTRASLSLSGRNLATLWQEQKTSEPYGNTRLGDPEKGRNLNHEFGGEPDGTAMPSAAHAVLTARISF